MLDNTTPFMPKGIKGFQKGHSVPLSLRLKLGRARIGKPSPRKGILHSQETKAKISLALNSLPEEIKVARAEKLRKAHIGRKQSNESIIKRVQARKGYRHSEETKQRISDGHRKRGIIPKTDESKIWRKRMEYRNWRQKVFERDNYSCQFCGTRGAILHAHHIRPFALFPLLRFEISNGITLCEDCHKTTPTWGEKAINYSIKSL